MNAETTRPARTPSFAWLAFLVGSAMLSAMVIVGLTVFSLANRLPVITPERFAAAQQQWADNQPASYSIEIAVSGLQAAVYRVEVRGGEPISAKRNGDALKDKRTWQTWTVPGMFRTIESDVNHSDLVPRNEETGPAIVVTPQGVFDEKYGYPVRYRRIEWGADLEVSWEVTTFEVMRSQDKAN